MRLKTRTSIYSDRGSFLKILLGCDMNRVVVTAMEPPMRRWVFVWVSVFGLQTSAHAADKIRISMKGFAG